MVLAQAKSVHFIGIGGSGLSAIARVLLEKGVRVSGSDRTLSPMAKSLQEAGARVFIGHHAENIQSVDLVIRSSAVTDANVEVVAARQVGIPVLKRVDFLRELMSGRIGIAVAGAHGKTTTTAMIAWMLVRLEKDPSFIIGGVSVNLETNAHHGKGPYFVIEADEYDRMFHGLRPALAVITNIEHDHPDCYPTEEDFYQAFMHFAGLLSPNGDLLICADDPGGRRLLTELPDKLAATTQQPVTELQDEPQAPLQSSWRPFSYGLEARSDVNVDYQAVDVKPNERGGYSFTALFWDQKMAHVHLQVPGLHNVRNALAALAAAHMIGLPLSAAAQALDEFRGAGRRFEVRGEAAGVVVIDDYAHHPTEIRATLAAARSRYAKRQLWVVWQPHTYSRSQALFHEFITAFSDANHVLVTEVFASRETPPPEGFSSRQLVVAMQHEDVHFVPSFAEAVALLLERLHPGDVLLVLSAGDADQISVQVLNTLKERKSNHV